jgi:hypothetical protein
MELIFDYNSKEFKEIIELFKNFKSSGTKNERKFLADEIDKRINCCEHIKLQKPDDITYADYTTNDIHTNTLYFNPISYGHKKIISVTFIAEEHNTGNLLNENNFRTAYEKNKVVISYKLTNDDREFIDVSELLYKKNKNIQVDATLNYRYNIKTNQLEVIYFYFPSFNINTDDKKYTSDYFININKNVDYDDIKNLKYIIDEKFTTCDNLDTLHDLLNNDNISDILYTKTYNDSVEIKICFQHGDNPEEKIKKYFDDKKNITQDTLDNLIDNKSISDYNTKQNKEININEDFII